MISSLQSQLTEDQNQRLENTQNFETIQADQPLKMNFSFLEASDYKVITVSSSYAYTQVSHSLFKPA